LRRNPPGVRGGIAYTRDTEKMGGEFTLGRKRVDGSGTESGVSEIRGATKSCQGKKKVFRNGGGRISKELDGQAAGREENKDLFVQEKKGRSYPEPSGQSKRLRAAESEVKESSASTANGEGTIISVKARDRVKKTCRKKAECGGGLD